MARDMLLTCLVRVSLWCWNWTLNETKQEVSAQNWAFGNFLIFIAHPHKVLTIGTRKRNSSYFYVFFFFHPTVVVVICFFISWGPFHVQRIIFTYIDHSSMDENLSFSLNYISGVLFFVSTFINPIIYNLLSSNFRKAFKVLFKFNLVADLLQFQLS